MRGDAAARRLALDVGIGRDYMRELQLVRRRSRVPGVFLVYHRALEASVLPAQKRRNVERRRLRVIG